MIILNVNFANIDATRRRVGQIGRRLHVIIDQTVSQRKAIRIRLLSQTATDAMVGARPLIRLYFGCAATVWANVTR